MEEPQYLVFAAESNVCRYLESLAEDHLVIPLGAEGLFWIQARAFERFPPSLRQERSCLVLYPTNQEAVTQQGAPHYAETFHDLFLRWDARWILDTLREERIGIQLEPLLDRNGHVVGFEALARGIEDGKIIPPARLFGAAARWGVVDQLDRLCLRKAVSLGWYAIQHFGPDGAFLSVNCGQETFQSLYPLRVAEETGIPTGILMLELVETNQLDLASLMGVSDWYRMKGFRIALDDVGRGYNSLARVTTLEPDVLKIDMSIVNGMGSNPTKQAIAEAVTMLGRRMGAMIVAEGVEERGDWEAGKSLGIDWYQGFYWARPTCHILDQEWLMKQT